MRKHKKLSSTALLIGVKKESLTHYASYHVNYMQKILEKKGK